MPFDSVRAATGATPQEEIVRNHRRLFVPTVVAIVTIVCSVAVPVHAESPTEPQSGWQFDFTPYLWGAGLNGTVQFGRLPAGGVEASFSDLASMLSFAAAGTFEVRRNRVGFLVDAFYVSLSTTQPTPDQTVYGDAEVDLSEQLYTPLLTYRAYEGEHTTVDAVAGARYYRIDSTLILSGGVAPGRQASGEVSWWDWVAGTRIIGHPSKNWSIMGSLDIAGAGSDFTWEALFGADYAFNKTVSLPFGYRYLSIDYDRDKFAYDMAMGGLYVGVGFHW